MEPARYIRNGWKKQPTGNMVMREEDVVLVAGAPAGTTTLKDLCADQCELFFNAFGRFSALNPLVEQRIGSEASMYASATDSSMAFAKLCMT
uniref:Uncharacterized protein n=1 Tax=Hyaloperonospora arabidopsidis (strain Emoy2) TaxID=559515 RepID=M4BID3_HYAAE